MERFLRLEGVCAALPRPDVDTDQIIPKQFLKRTDRVGYGEACFFDWRYDEAGSKNPEFELNHPSFQGATVLAAGPNFGCGSSREHAVWALMGMGYRAILAPSFADIFHSNSLQNGLLPVALPAADVERILERAGAHRGYRLTVDLQEQQVSDDDGWVSPFSIDTFWRECLLSGRDPLEMALSQEERIAAFESRRPDRLPRSNRLLQIT